MKIQRGVQSQGLAAAFDESDSWLSPGCALHQPSHALGIPFQVAFTRRGQQVLTTKCIKVHMPNWFRSEVALNLHFKQVDFLLVSSSREETLAELASSSWRNTIVSRPSATSGLTKCPHVWVSHSPWCILIFNTWPSKCLPYIRGSLPCEHSSWD